MMCASIILYAQANLWPNISSFLVSVQCHVAATAAAADKASSSPAYCCAAAVTCIYRLSTNDLCSRQSACIPKRSCSLAKRDAQLHSICACITCAVVPLQALAKDPAARPTVVQLQRHPFLAPYTTPEMLRWSAAVDVPVSWALAMSCVG